MVACARPTQDQANLFILTWREVEAHESPPLNEDLLAVDVFSGRKGQAFFRGVVDPW